MWRGSAGRSATGSGGALHGVPWLDFGVVVLARFHRELRWRAIGPQCLAPGIWKMR